MKTNEIFEKNIVAFNLKTRYIVNQGGARAGKTFAILQVLLLKLLKSKTPIIISVVSQSIPHLKLGAIRDFKMICQSLNIIFDNYFNKSEQKFELNNSIIEFFSTDNLGKVHGPGRDYLFINECNNIPYEVFEQLEIRTRKSIFLDFNPINRFWVHTEILDKLPEKSILIKSTYKDNLAFLAPEIIESIEGKKNKLNWWRIYGEGEVGYSENLLFAQEKLQRFSLKDLTFEDIISVSYTDTANGGDYFCTVYGVVKNKLFYVVDVIYNKEMIDYNQKYLPLFIKKYNIQKNVIESNAQGYLFAHNIRNNIEKKNEIKLKNSSTNKEERIRLNSIIVLDYFAFRNDFEPNSEYDLFFKDLTNYTYGEKNKHDDAPDAVTGLAVELFYSKMI
jgi:PBSX family phage terminase large subunit